MKNIRCLNCIKHLLLHIVFVITIVYFGYNHNQGYSYKPNIAVLKTDTIVKHYGKNNPTLAILQKSINYNK